MYAFTRPLAGLSVAMLLAAPGALAEGKQNFTLKNKTGYTISEVYVSPSKASSWEEDVLGRDQLGDGESVDITFARSEKSCKWDLKVVYDDEETAEWEGFNLCEVSTIRIFYDRKKDSTWAEYE
ncbi:hypothetical protein [Niveispirillum sp. KHB5.9]|uniref:hypothetical protein n=1 Tax=Niveispirillum sp. KHB5.9 TaxID=3400269 RepID=UPI003A8A3E08